MLQEIDAVAEAEHRTRSDLVREAVRRYVHEANQRRANARPAFFTKPVPVQHTEEL
jgi:metal-responsive CopG/Arc/MetJ family transcriptional regulator